MYMHQGQQPGEDVPGRDARKDPDFEMLRAQALDRLPEKERSHTVVLPGAAAGGSKDHDLSPRSSVPLRLSSRGCWPAALFSPTAFSDIAPRPAGVSRQFPLQHQIVDVHQGFKAARELATTALLFDLRQAKMVLSHKYCAQTSSTAKLASTSWPRRWPLRIRTTSSC